MEQHLLNAHTHSYVKEVFESHKNCIGTTLLGQALNFYWVYSQSKTNKREKLLNVFRW